MIFFAVLLVFAYIAIKKLPSLDERLKVPVRPPGLPPSLPWPGEIWWASVPFSDLSGAKDRPCLVVSTNNGHLTVVKITSKLHAGARSVIVLPPGSVGDPQGRQSYLQAGERRILPPSAFRRRAGTVDLWTWRRTQWYLLF